MLSFECHRTNRYLINFISLLNATIKEFKTLISYRLEQTSTHDINFKSCSKTSNNDIF